MFGEKTAIVLGAGASYCYGGGTVGIPVQQTIIGDLFFGADSGSGEGFPSFVGPSGPQHSFRLANYLRKRFGVPEDPKKKNSKMDFWTAIQEQGYNLESLYSALDTDLGGGYRILLEDFAAIVRTAVLRPVGERGIESVCPHHRRICEALEPGDYIIDFNWDSVMADALLYYSHFWFPVTGFGVAGVNPLLPACQKALPISSLVTLLHVHGSVLLYELDDAAEPQRRGLLYLGPRQWSAFTGILSLQGVSLSDLRAGTRSLVSRPELAPLEERVLQHGHIYLEGNWFKPLFIPPSAAKREYQHWFFRSVIRAIHSRLPSTTRIVIAGYSFPDADIGHLREIFVPGVINEQARVEIVNPSNDDEEFRRRVQNAFPAVKDLSFGEKDFRVFCAELDIDYPDRPSLRAGEKGDRARRAETEMGAANLAPIVPPPER